MRSQFSFVWCQLSILLLIVIVIVNFIPLTFQAARRWNPDEIVAAAATKAVQAHDGSYQSYCTREADCDKARNLRCDLWHHKCVCSDIFDLVQLVHFQYVALNGGCVLRPKRGRPCDNIAIGPSDRGASTPGLGSCQSHSDCTDRHGLTFVSCDFQTCECKCDENDAHDGARVRVINGTCVLEGSRQYGEPCFTSFECDMDNNVFCTGDGDPLRCTCNPGHGSHGHIWNPELRKCEPAPAKPCDKDEDCNSEDSYGMYAKCSDGGQANKTKVCECMQNTSLHNGLCVSMARAMDVDEPAHPNPEGHHSDCVPGVNGVNCGSNGTHTWTEPRPVDGGGGTPTKDSSSTSVWYFMGPAAALLVVVVLIAAGFAARWRYNAHKAPQPSDDPREPSQPVGGRLPHVARSEFYVDTERELGHGKGGIVYRGSFRNVPIAVKTLNPSCQRPDTYLECLHQEIDIFKALHEHPNVIKLLAYSYSFTVAGANLMCSMWECFLLMELCTLGSLRDFLRASSYNDPKAYVSSVQQVEKGYNDMDLLTIAVQIATGAEFLAEQRVVHGDLACRNILLHTVDGERVAKITDFGLGRKLGESSVYTRSKPGPVPWQSCAPEVLTRNEFSIASDVWAFGVLLWELFSRGEEPYEGENIDMGPARVASFGQELYEGQWPLPKPELASDQIYEVMKSCWRPVPGNRPSFTELRAALDSIREQMAAAPSGGEQELPVTAPADGHYIQAVEYETSDSEPDAPTPTPTPTPSDSYSSSLNSSTGAGSVTLEMRL